MDASMWVMPSERASGTAFATSASENCQMPMESIGITTLLLSRSVGILVGGDWTPVLEARATRAIRMTSPTSRPAEMAVARDGIIGACDLEIICNTGCEVSDLRRDKERAPDTP